MKSPLIQFLLVCLTSTAVFGQAASRNAPESKRQPPGGAAAMQQVSTQELLRQNGGSLLRAQLANAPVENRNSLETVSFFHVAPPEPRTISKHDLITIIIREESSAKTDAKADMSRSAAFQAKLDEFIKLSFANFALEGGGVGAVPPSIKASGDRSFQGDGKFDRKDTFTARIQAEVLDVKPNGNLVLQARKNIKTDEEEQYFVLSGTCRAEDVTADNSVLSTQLFDLDLSKSTKGPVKDSIKRGKLHKFLDWLNPF